MNQQNDIDIYFELVKCSLDAQKELFVAGLNALNWGYGQPSKDIIESMFKSVHKITEISLLGKLTKNTFSE